MLKATSNLLVIWCCSVECVSVYSLRPKINAIPGLECLTNNATLTNQLQKKRDLENSHTKDKSMSRSFS
jgi:hypothetical protein